VGISYVFGTINHELTTLPASGGLLTGGKVEHSELSGLGAKFGVLAQSQGWTFSGTIELPTEIRVERSLEIIGADSVGIGAETMSLPLGLGFGAAHKFGRYLAAGETRFEFWESADHVLGDSYKNSWNVAVALERQRLNQPLLSWYDQLSFRAGFHAGQLNIEAGGNPVLTTGLSLGFGIPMRTHPAMLDFAVTMDWRGSTGQNGVSERILGVRMGFTSTERWFARRKR
jgi:hypothetical protein